MNRIGVGQAQARVGDQLAAQVAQAGGVGSQPTTRSASGSVATPTTVA